MSDYEKYQLQWMIDHRITLHDLVTELEEMQRSFPDEPVNVLYEAWEGDRGFHGMIWACEDEWKDVEGKS